MADALQTSTEPVLRAVLPSDGEAIARIYNHYIEHTVVTFETDPVEADVMTARIGEAIDDGLPYFVAEIDGEVAGFAYASKWKGRCAYRYSVESTVYLDPGQTGKGLGSRLYQELIEAIREMGMHAIIGGISLPNEASIALHEKLGFEKTGQFVEVGYKFDRWVDVGYWQLTL
jgi:phosphinothricin acetyltransferase